MQYRSLLFALLFLIAPLPSHAESVAHVFDDFGLLGTWAANCTAPAGETNWYVTYSVLPSGHVSRKYYKGPEPFNEYVVTTATSSGDKISFHVEGQELPLHAFDIVLVKNGSTVTVWQSYKDNEFYLVKEGRATDSHIPSDVLSKCK